MLFICEKSIRLLKVPFGCEDLNRHKLAFPAAFQFSYLFASALNDDAVGYGRVIRLAWCEICPRDAAKDDVARFAILECNLRFAAA